MSPFHRWSRAARSVAATLLPLSLVLVLSPGCSESPPTGPPIAKTIEIHEITFKFTQTTIRVGDWVAWENVVREDRTVTSGTGLDDPEAGALFDVMLEGYSPGEPVGGRYVRQFTEPDTIQFFTRKYPAQLAEPFTGTLFVVP